MNSRFNRRFFFLVGLVIILLITVVYFNYGRYSFMLLLNINNSSVSKNRYWPDSKISENDNLGTKYKQSGEFLDKYLIAEKVDSIIPINEPSQKFQTTKESSKSRDSGDNNNDDGEVKLDLFKSRLRNWEEMYRDPPVFIPTTTPATNDVRIFNDDNINDKGKENKSNKDGNQSSQSKQIDDEFGINLDLLEQLGFEDKDIEKTLLLATQTKTGEVSVKDDTNKERKREDDTDIDKGETGTKTTIDEKVAKGLIVEEGIKTKSGEETNTRSEKDVKSASIERKGLVSKSQQNKENSESRDSAAEREASISVPTVVAGFPGKSIPADLRGWHAAPTSSQYFWPIDEGEAWVYSAFYDDFDHSDIVVRLIGIIKISLPRTVQCHFMDTKRHLQQSVAGTISPIREKPYFLYLTMIIACPIPERSLQPRLVSITFNRKYDQSTNQIQIQYPDQRRRNFTVCHSPFHSHFNNTWQLIQSVQLNQILGAQHFVFYNFSTTPEVSSILRHYEIQGIATIQQWPIPVLGTWYYGQLAAINDCIFRQRRTSQFVVLVDTDEFILPTNHSNWSELLNDVMRDPSHREEIVPCSSINKTNSNDESSSSENNSSSRKLRITCLKDKDVASQKRNTEFGGFSFKHVMHKLCILSKNDKKNIQKALNLTGNQMSFLKKLNNELPKTILFQPTFRDNFFDHERRSKMIVRPEAVHTASVHKMIRYKKGYRIAYVANQTASLNHYKNPDINGECERKDLSTLRQNYVYGLVESLKALRKSAPSLFSSGVG